MSASARQMDALRFIRGYQLAHGGVSPTLTTIMAGIGCPSKGCLHRFLVLLERAGLLRRAKHRQQWIEVLTDIPVPRAPDGAPLYFVRVP